MRLLIIYEERSAKFFKSDKRILFYREITMRLTKYSYLFLENDDWWKKMLNTQLWSECVSSIYISMLVMLAHRASRASCSNVKPLEHFALSSCFESSVLYSSTHSVNFVSSDRLVTVFFFSLIFVSKILYYVFSQS